jgi:hypothetical protein
MFGAIGDGPSLWEASLPPKLLRLPDDLVRVDALLDDAAFFAQFAPQNGTPRPGRTGMVVIFASSRPLMVTWNPSSADSVSASVMRLKVIPAGVHAHGA